MLLSVSALCARKCVCDRDRAVSYWGRERERESEGRRKERRRLISQRHSDVKMTDNAGAAGPLAGFIGP